MSDLWRPWSLRELVTSGMTSAEALARSRARISETEPELRAWVERFADPEPAEGPLGGVPLGVKDIIDVAGVPTRCGTPLRGESEPADADATIVTAWRQAGAMPVGKTVTTEFAYFAPGPTRNPAAPNHTPGGSSSGSAAAVASGQVPLALGTQTAGSVIRPASFCGVAALVLTHSRFTMAGVNGLSPSLDSHGVYAATVDDLALAWSALMSEADPALAAPRPPRLLVWAGAAGREMRAALANARERLTAAGAVITDFPENKLIEELTAAHAVVMAYEAAREHAAELAVASVLSEQLAQLLRTGATTPEHDHLTARRTFVEAGRRVAELLDSFDAILAPAAAGPAPAGLASTGDPVVSRPWQALGLPAVTVPGARDAEGLPLGLQFVGPAWSDAALLATGCWAETVLSEKDSA
jgi:Asp-tRNA(Asn)/Glu-tRNA(Gln) amidotransferase A subunit family amidase